MDCYAEETEFSKMYRCPYCLGHLGRVTNSKLTCLKCHQEIRIINGIPIFSNTENYFFGPFPKDLVKSITSQSGTIHTQDPILVLMKEFNQGKSGKLFQRKAYLQNMPWQLLIRNTNKKRALDFGCGLGFSTISLAGVFQEVYACDLTFENLEIIKKRAEYHSIKNIKYCCGINTDSFPFDDDFFDIIYLNGVFEHVGDNLCSIDHQEWSKLRKGIYHIKTLFGDTNPKTIQKHFLKELFRILKYDGSIFIGIENRLSYKYFLGYPEEHIKLRFIALLPRIIANVYSLFLKRIPYRVATHTYFSYHKLLRESGFKSTRLYAMDPNYSICKKITDLDKQYKGDKRKTIYSQSDKKNISSQIKDTIIFQKFFSPCFGITAGKADITSNVLEEVVTDITIKLGQKPSSLLIEPFYSVTDKGTFTIKLSSDEHNHLIVKIPLNSYTQKKLNQNFEGLSFIHKNSEVSESLKKLVPKPILKSLCNHHEYFVEELKPGIPSVSYRKNGESFNNILKRGAFLITSLHTEIRVFSDKRDEIQIQLIEKLLKRLSTICSLNDNNDIIIRLRTFLIDKLLSEKLPLVFNKGDFSANNILVDSELNIKAFIDWDQSNHNYFPLIDLMQLLESFRRHATDTGLGRILTDYYFKDNFQELERSLINDYCMKLCVPKESLLPLTMVFWLEHLYSQSDDMVLFNKAWIESNINQVLNSIREII